MNSLERLAKWRVLLTGWQLGTREKGDPEADALRDHREATLMLRVEVNTLTGLLVRKGVFTEAEFTEALLQEAEMYEADLQRRFPGIAADDHGLIFDKRAIETMKGWNP